MDHAARVGETERVADGRHQLDSVACVGQVGDGEDRGELRPKLGKKHLREPKTLVRSKSPNSQIHNYISSFGLATGIICNVLI